MSPKPLVSIIMPFLNAERFIEEAVESVLSQTLTAWELAIVDDGSTDGSTATARRYATRYPGRISYIEHDGHQNLGASASRNLGIRHTSGEYIALLDADDIWLPHKLEQQVPMLSSNPAAGMLYGNTEYWYSWTGRPEDRLRDYLPRRIHRNAVLPPPILLTLYLRGEAVVPCTCSVLMRRAVVERVNAFEEEFRTLYDDQVLYAKMLLAAPVIVVDQCWDRYRQSPESSCSRALLSDYPRTARLDYLNWVARYLTAHGIRDAQLWHALEHERWRSRHPQMAKFVVRARRVLKGVQGWHSTRAQKSSEGL